MALTLSQSRLVVLVSLPIGRSEPPSQAEVADLELAIRVDEEVTRFQISVDDVGRMNVLQHNSVSDWYKKRRRGMEG